MLALSGQYSGVCFTTTLAAETFEVAKGSSIDRETEKSRATLPLPPWRFHDSFSQTIPSSLIDLQIKFLLAYTII